MSLRHLRYPGKLAQKLALYIVLFSSVLALIITVAELSIEYRRDVGYIEDRIGQIERAYLPSLIENLWVADRERLKTQLDGITNLPDFVMAEIHVDGKLLMRSGDNRPGSGITRTFPLWRVHRGQHQQIGTLVVAASYDAVFQRTIHRLAFFLGANLIKTLFVILFVFAIFYRLIGRHIESIARYASQGADLQEIGPVVLDRHEPRASDEFSELVGALNGMRKKLRRQHELLLQRIQELRIKDAAIASSINAIAIAGLDGRLSYVNQAFVDLWRLKGPQEALGRSPIELWETPETGQAVMQVLGQQDHWQGELCARLADGARAEIQLSANMVFDEAGKRICMMLSLLDITARKRAETAMLNMNQELERRVDARTALLRAAKEEAEQANLAKSLFLSSMSHEIRTPLNAIIGYAQLLEMDDELVGNPRANVREIRQAGNHLLALVNDLLDLSRIESGKHELRIETVDLAAVLAESWAQNSEAARSRNITFVKGCDCGRYQVRVDRRRLLQALNNLISNAIKYNRSNGSVNLSCSAPSPGRIKITVTDSGLGIAPDKLPQLFQPFNRLGAEMGSIEGSGIGLAISRQLLEAMDGAIGVGSTPGVGSAFWLEVPGQASAEPGPIAIAGEPSNEASGRPTRVLVAEDYAPNQAVLQLQLHSLGCEVEMVADGAAALARWRSGQYDLILSDINMPVMNGLELVEAVRRCEMEHGGHIPVVGITAAAMPSELQRCRAAGMDDVLSKPIELEDLRGVLSRWTDSVPSANGKSPLAQERPGDATAIFDVDHLYRVLGQVNLVHAQELIALFIRSAAEGLAHLATQTEDRDAVAREMHKQKSSARTVGALRYARHATALEQQAKAGNRIYLDGLRGALADFELAAARLDASRQATEIAAPRHGVSPSASYGAVLVIDDDPVVLQQMTVMLAGLGVKEVLTADNGLAALEIMKHRGDGIEALVCDLNMPEMDGVQLIRQFHRTDFGGGLILMSGADEKVLNTVSELAGRQGLRVLGQAQKPVIPSQMAALLGRLTESIIGKHFHGAATEVSGADIREGIYKDEFAIWFQPKVDAISLRPIGVEALARWRRPDGSEVPPGDFIVAAERQGLIGELSQILVSKALLEGARLHHAGYPLKIAVNLSGRWLDDLNLPDFVLATAKMAGLKVGDILFEVTETGVMEDLTTALDVLSRLRLKGFGLAIDDFGIGYSSFEQLGRIPFTEMKLDRSFVIKGNQDVAARAILESSMDMAQKLRLFTVAEGVETPADLELVRSLGCDAVQGYLLAKPMPVAELLAWLKTNQEQSS